jgi:hypothetical protein
LFSIVDAEMLDVRVKGMSSVDVGGWQVLSDRDGCDIGELA